MSTGEIICVVLLVVFLAAKLYFVVIPDVKLQDYLARARWEAELERLKEEQRQREQAFLAEPRGGNDALR